MNDSVDTAFAELDEALNLDPSQRRQAQERHKDIRKTLTAAGFVASTFLQGSFARKTMLKPLKDVDIVVVLKSSSWAQLGGADGPATAMKWFKAAVGTQWPDAEFDRGDEPSGKALRVSFRDIDFDFDLVPAFECGDSDDVLIGDRRERRWEQSSTRRLNREISARNQTTDGRFVHRVRELKQFAKNHTQLDFFKGIVMESLAFRVVTEKEVDKIVFANVLNYGRTALRGAVPDPTGQDDVTVKWTSSERQVAVSIFEKRSAQATEALQLEINDDTEASIDLWHYIIGEPFPTAAIRTPAATLAAWNALGSRTSTGRPTTAVSGRQPTRPGRAWAPR